MKSRETPTTRIVIRALAEIAAAPDLDCTGGCRKAYTRAGRGWVHERTTFDTYAAAKRLRDAGFDEDQAEAAVTMVRDAIGSDRDQLATKADIAEIRTALANAVNRMLLAQIAIAGLLFAAIKLF